MPQAIVALVEDLVFTAKLRAAAHGIEVALQIASQPEEWLQLVRRASPTLVLIDLNFSRADALALVAQARTATNDRATPIVGFLSHVQAERALAARTAGCTAAIPRSLFVQLLPALLRDGVAALQDASDAAPAA